MEILLSQRFNYAKITLYKDYCDLKKDKKRVKVETKPYDQNIFSFETMPHNQTLFLRPKNKKNKFFFVHERDSKSTDTSYEDRVNIDIGKPIKYDFHTTKDTQIKRNFARPFSDVSIITIERSIIKKDDKITIKLYIGFKNRGVNCRYFKKRYNSYSLTFNTKTGNFIVGSVSNLSGEKNAFRTNNFTNLKQIFLKNIQSFKIVENKRNPSTTSCLKLMNKELNDRVFFEKMFECLEMSNVQFNTINDIEYEFLKYFINKKRIKVPNGDWKIWLTNFYPTEKFLKKNDRKLIASVLDLMGIKSKVTIKILHDVPNINILGLFKVCKLFGKDFHKYVGNIKRNILFNSLRTDSENYTFSKNYQYYKVESNNFDLNEQEKDNLLKLINSTKIYDKSFLSSHLIVDLMDHFDMIRKIRIVDPNCQMMSKNVEEFKNEHTELTKIMSAIKKGWVVEYIYDEKLKTDIEESINSHYFIDENEEDADMVVLYPKMLTREEDYIEEGKTMHHCVATYSNKDSSLIVSIRNESNDDRVTCEFDIQSGNLIQAKHFCNAQPPKKFNEAILKLAEKIKRNARWGTLNWKEKKKVPVMINGVQIDPELINPVRNQISPFDALYF